MAAAILSPQNCCDPCATPSTTNIPGPQGAAGAAGAAGADGVTAYTQVADYAPNPQPQMPYPIQVLSTITIAGNAQVTLASTATLVPGMRVSGTGIAAGSTIQSVDDATHVTLTLQATASATNDIEYRDQVTVNTTTSTDFIIEDEIVYVQGWGYMAVLSVPSDTSVMLENLEDSDGHYGSNAAQGLSLSALNKIVPGGLQGLDGDAAAAGAPAAASYWTRVAEGGLSSESAIASIPGMPGLIKASALGVPDKAVAGVDFLDPLTGLIPADIGAIVQGWDALLDALAALVTVADRLIYTTGVNTVALSTLTAFARTLLDDADAATARNTLEVLAGYGLLGSVTALDLNVPANDNAVTINATRYRIDRVTLENPSAAVTTATLGLFTAAGGGGTTLCTNQALAGSLTGTTKLMDLVESGVVDTDVRTEGTLYARSGTAEGAARTVNVKIYGWKYA